MESKTPMNVEPVEVSSTEYTRRVLFECNASSSELSSGKIVRVSNPSKVFVPSKDPALTEEAAAEWDKRDFSNAIVTEVKLRSVSSNCPEPVTIGMNLFENGVDLVNTEGWLFAQPPSDMSTEHVHVADNYLNLTTVLPHERQRPNEVMYHPDMGKMKSAQISNCLLYTSPSPRDGLLSRMPSSA